MRISLQRITDAQNIPFKGLVDRINATKDNFSYMNDDLAFLSVDGFPKTVPGEILMQRLTTGILNRDPDAVEVYNYFKTQPGWSDAATQGSPGK